MMNWLEFFDIYMQTDVIDLATTLKILFRVGVAALCGALIGFERENHSNSIGIRTQMLIGAGSAIFALIPDIIVPNTTPADYFRFIGQIVTSIGFLGAGAIFKDNNKITGLTTGALIWITSGIGILCGAGFWILAIILDVATFLTIWFTYKKHKNNRE